MICLDSDILIDFLQKGHHKKFIEENWRNCATTWTNKYEIFKGIKHPKARKTAEKFFSKITILDMKPGVTEQALKLHAELTRKGTLINNSDIFIAATTLSYNIQHLATNNIKHFKHIGQIKLIDIT